MVFYFQTELKSMLYAFGYSKHPHPFVLQHLENITQAQIRTLINLASRVRSYKRARVITVEDICFVLRFNKNKVKRIMSSIVYKDLRKKIIEDEGGDLDIAIEEIKYDWFIERNKRIVIKKRGDNIFGSNNKLNFSGNETDQTILTENDKNFFEDTFMNNNILINNVKNKNENKNLNDIIEMKKNTDYENYNLNINIGKKKDADDKKKDIDEEINKLNIKNENSNDDKKKDYDEENNNLYVNNSNITNEYKINQAHNIVKIDDRNLNSFKENTISNDKNESENFQSNDSCLVEVSFSEEEDFEHKERLKRIDALTCNMTKQEYLEFSECRQASFTYRKSKRFKEFLCVSEKLNEDVIEILGYVAYEMIQDIIDAALNSNKEFKNEIENLQGPFQENFLYGLYIKEINNACKKILKKKNYLFM